MIHIFETPKYKEYRNPRFEKTVRYASAFVNSLIKILSAILLQKTIGYITSLFVVVAFELIVNMNKSTIYFCDNKGLGPGWKTQFLEDLAISIRTAAIISIIGYIVATVLKEFSIL